jgi:hypothetical protein
VCPQYLNSTYGERLFSSAVDGKHFPSSFLPALTYLDFQAELIAAWPDSGEARSSILGDLLRKSEASGKVRCPVGTSTYLDTSAAQAIRNQSHNCKLQVLIYIVIQWTEPDRVS